MKSIRSYLLQRLLGGAALVLVGAGCAVYLVVTRAVERQFDVNLTNRVQGFASILFQQEDRVDFEFSEELMPEYEPGERAAYFELWFADGRLLERSNSLADGDLELRGTPSTKPAHWSAPLPDGRPGRYAARTIEVHHVYPELGPDRPEAAHVLVVIAMGREELVAAEDRVFVYCGVGALALMVLLAVVTWRSVERGLEPTNRLVTTLDAIRLDELPDGLDVGPLPTELVPIANTTDALIRRVGAAFRRERRTTADIAHELRSPISELLTVSEVALRNGMDEANTRRALGTVRDVAWRMGRAVSTLLKLARLEMGAEKFAAEEVDLGSILQELLRALSAVERERSLVVRNHVATGEVVCGDGEVLRIVLSNLLGNAMHYSPTGGEVAIRMERRAGGWGVRVENAAGDLQPADLGTLAEPFWRKDRARADRDRSGLGLALSRALAEATGLRLRFEIVDGIFRAALGSLPGEEAMRPTLPPSEA